MAFYEKAITQNPGNILARSYMGQAHLLAGEKEQAAYQLSMIQAHDGAGTWAEQSLKTALETGKTYNY